MTYIFLLQVFIDHAPSAPDESVSLDSQSSIDSLRIQLPCHRKQREAKFEKRPPPPPPRGPPPPIDGGGKDIGVKW